MKYDEQNSLVIYEGAVKVQQEKFSLKADKLLVYQKKNKIHKMVSFGQRAQVVLPQPDGTEAIAHAEVIEYDLTTEEILLKQNAQFAHQQDCITGPQLRYHVTSTQLTTPNSSGRVRIVLQPNSTLLRQIQ